MSFVACRACGKALATFPSYRKRRTFSGIHKSCVRRGRTVVVPDASVSFRLVKVQGRWVIRGTGFFEYRARFMMECLLGRRLARLEYVHHKDGNKTNDSFENLEVVNASDHTRHHMKEAELSGRPWFGGKRTTKMPAACRLCGEVKEAGGWYWTHGKKRSSYCKLCMNARRRSRR